jgi:hypothetical protein
MTPTPPFDPDEELLADLARAVRIFDPPPGELTAANKELLSWSDPDVALAELVADSRELAGAARGPGDEVLLRFDGGGVSIVVQVETTGTGGYRLLGQVEPVTAGDGATRSGVGAIALRRPTVERLVPCDDWGRFRLDGVRPGPVRLRWIPAADGVTPVDTAWTLL